MYITEAYPELVYGEGGGGGVKKSIINPHVKSLIAVIPCYSLQWVNKKIGGVQRLTMS